MRVAMKLVWSIGGTDHSLGGFRIDACPACASSARALAKIPMAYVLTHVQVRSMHACSCAHAHIPTFAHVHTRTHAAYAHTHTNVCAHSHM